MTFAYTYEDPEYQREADEEDLPELEPEVEIVAVESQDDRPLYIWLR
jgi:hypothetical protein